MTGNNNHNECNNKIFKTIIKVVKKPLSLKCVINDALIGSQSDKVPSLIRVCIEVRISL